MTLQVNGRHPLPIHSSASPVSAQAIGLISCGQGGGGGLLCLAAIVGHEMQRRWLMRLVTKIVTTMWSPVRSALSGDIKWNYVWLDLAPLR